MSLKDSESKESRFTSVLSLVEGLTNAFLIRLMCYIPTPRVFKEVNYERTPQGPNETRKCLLVFNIYLSS